MIFNNKKAETDWFQPFFEGKMKKVQLFAIVSVLSVKVFCLSAITSVLSINFSVLFSIVSSKMIANRHIINTNRTEINSNSIEMIVNI